MRHRHQLLELPLTVDLPTGNVHVLPQQSMSTGPQATGGWQVHNGDGDVIEVPLETRAEALRHMCLLALRGAPLPLTLHDRDGNPTGDRLP